VLDGRMITHVSCSGHGLRLQDSQVQLVKLRLQAAPPMTGLML
jgi:hypothetical protein